MESYQFSDDQNELEEIDEEEEQKYMRDVDSIKIETMKVENVKKIQQIQRVQLNNSNYELLQNIQFQLDKIQTLKKLNELQHCQYLRTSEKMVKQDKYIEIADNADQLSHDLLSEYSNINLRSTIFSKASNISYYTTKKKQLETQYAKIQELPYETRKGELQQLAELLETMKLKNTDPLQSLQSNQREVRTNKDLTLFKQIWIEIEILEQIYEKFKQQLEDLELQMQIDNKQSQAEKIFNEISILSINEKISAYSELLQDIFQLKTNITNNNNNKSLDNEKQQLSVNILHQEQLLKQKEYKIKFKLLDKLRKSILEDRPATEQELNIRERIIFSKPSKKEWQMLNRYLNEFIKKRSVIIKSKKSQQVIVQRPPDTKFTFIFS